MKNVSVVIPFKGEIAFSGLKNAVRSLLVQTILPQEIILVGSLAEINNQKEAYSFILSSKLIKFISFAGDKNEARNIGIKESRGEFIMYLDHDMVAEKHLIEDCVNKSGSYDALIIPEKGAGGNFWENCKKLERELITYDLYTVTPRFYKKSIFKKNESPFDSRFGLLDEWGFNNKLIKKKVALGYSKSYVVVKEADFRMIKNMVNKFNRGLWMKNFYKIDKEDAWRRVNPIKRGLIFYSKRLNYFFTDPVHFIGLIMLKTLDFVSFMSGYIIGSFVNSNRTPVNRDDLIRHYDLLGDNYLKKMYTTNLWTEYVNSMEKIAVANLWDLVNLEKNSQKLLDLGMGPGRWSEYFINLGIDNVYGLDISPVMVEQAKKRIKKYNFKGVVGSMDNLPFDKKLFDKVFCFRAFKYAENSDQVLKEIYRVLKPSGTFLLEVSNRSITNMIISTIAKILSFFHGRFSYKSKWGYFGKSRFYNKKEIIHILKSNNFKIQRIEPLFTLPSVPLPSKNGMVGFWIILDKIFSRILSRNLFCRSWIILITKK